MVVIIIGVFAFMFACMAILYLTFTVLMIAAATAKFDEWRHQKLDAGALPPALPRA